MFPAGTFLSPLTGRRDFRRPWWPTAPSCCCATGLLSGVSAQAVSEINPSATTATLLRIILNLLASASDAHHTQSEPERFELIFRTSRASTRARRSPS
ncbi:hypothetical protein SAMN05660733_04217 [Lentzea albidocapillata]|uniref:Uncharacterized protein n=1 Tax=Lentzea albidocapillata TaxID=40571 RepID=A0A1W2ENI3_9PSEU|nr:hypothetical protein SAMN05660733_04217 [Lentzea albidocapillata]